VLGLQQIDGRATEKAQNNQRGRAARKTRKGRRKQSKARRRREDFEGLSGEDEDIRKCD
jgi:hypothetical protein